MKKVEVVAAVIRRDRFILCCQREQNKLIYLSEKWEFPGGKIEEGESKEHALMREIQEELEMEIFDLRFVLTVVHNYEDFELTMHVYFATTRQIEFKLNSHMAARWVGFEELEQFDWAEADRPIVSYILGNSTQLQ